MGYHQFDFLENKNVPCSGRELSTTCHYIEISFLKAAGIIPLVVSKKWISFIDFSKCLWILVFLQKKINRDRNNPTE